MEIIINNNLFNVKSAITDKDIQEGMQGKKFDDNFNGMLFIMVEGVHSFWMKDCLISLDIIFISDGKIQKIYSDCPPCREQDDSNCPRYEGVGDMILEISGGDCIKYDITEGDSILIKE
jgi:uncharacterized membrane protein (UPF0127 family)